jgi:adenylate cyclase
MGAMSSMESMPKAREAALRSIALDPSLSAGHSSLAFVKAHYEFDWPGAEREYLRALDLNPNDAYAHVFYSNSYLSPHGRHAEAVDEMQKAIAIDPFSAPVESFLGRTYIWSREYDKDGNRGRTGFRLASAGSKISGSLTSSRLELAKTALRRGAKRPHP